MGILDILKKSTQRVITGRNPASDWDRGFDSLGDLRAVYYAINGMLNGNKEGIRKISGVNEQLEQSLVSWAFVCIDRIAKEMASSELYLSKRKKDEWEKVDLSGDYKADQFMQLLYAPFAYGNDASLKEIVQRHIEATGFCCLEKKYLNEGKTIVNGLEPITPDCISPIRTRSGMIVGWVMQDGIGQRELLKDDVIYIHYPNPKDHLSPLSPLMAGSYGVDLNNSLYDYNAKLVKNDARPSGWAVPRGDKIITKEQIGMVKSWARAMIGVKGGIEVAPMGFDIQGTTMSPKDMDFVEGLKTISNEICNAFGYPRALITGESQNRSVMEVLQYLKNVNCLIPRMTIIESALTMQLVYPILGRDYWLSFERPKLVFSEDARTAIEQVRAGMITINEWRESEGKDEVDWGNEPPKQSNPLMQPFNPPPEPPKALPEKVLMLKSPRKTFDKAVEWKGFDDAVRLNELPFKDVMARYFNQLLMQAKAKAKNQVESGKPIAPDIIDYESAKAKAMDYMRPFIVNAIEHGYNRGTRQAGTGQRFEMDIWTKGFVETKLLKSATEITETTRRAMIKLCDDHKPKSAKDSVTITLESFISDLNDLFSTWEDSRAKGIAETETVGSMNWGIQSGYQDSGVEKKEWLSQQDDRVRGNGPNDQYDHRLDGSVIGINYKFNTGGIRGLEFPGDPEGEPGDIINCRCTILPSWED